MDRPESSFSEIDISLGEGLPAMPERLLLAHARGEVLFLCGAGISKPAGLPLFSGLTLEIYRELDPAVYDVLTQIDLNEPTLKDIDCSSLAAPQKAEVNRFVKADFDVALGMLERRLDNQTDRASQVRLLAAKLIREGASSPASIHRSLMRLSDRGGTTAIVTTNFDLLLQSAGKQLGITPESYALGSIPRPMRKVDWSGVMHIHGMIDPSPKRLSEVVLSEQDFGEHYLRRRTVPDFIYDAARLYHLVLVGYSANDPPMRYLLNAVAADSQRFDDLKERFTFVPATQRDPVEHADWRARHITPIHYNSRDNHQALYAGLARWADLSVHNGKPNIAEQEVRRIVRKRVEDSNDADKDLFRHLFRRANTVERVRLSGTAKKAGAEIGWLTEALSVCDQSDGGAAR